MDPSVNVFYGPNPVQKTGTVTVPRELLREIGVEPGVDRVHWALNPDIEGTLILIPSTMQARAMEGAFKALRRVAR